MRNVTNRKSSPLIQAHAIDIARAALEEVGEGGVGKHIGVAGMGANVATHRFAADVPGYPGWEWQAVVACAAGSRHVTVNEVALVPGGSALQAPDWVPYSERLRPGDLGPGDLMPPAPDDERLDEGELSPAGLAQAEKRWRAEYGPNSEMAAQAPLQCKTCAFYLPFLPNFGVCANEYSADGRAVHATYGCGAHSGIKLKEDLRPSGSAFDDEKPIY
ncbi:DUF3027 domain-containing protein [Corynebacterium flavescens]|uniref:Uncharacterized protein n=1 Tax=Corynebacterium flavescens TaxID=28028 RepID=A0A1L7CKN2_CORFL|nr:MULTISPECIES: DUF3027 domain-containing protein [Corynebacterium]APT86412.1 hypothetical protein CFLV_03890 [Corynebacterium flavescens]KAA8723618.1 DUF3027 domain-containing protein [Corynebacterium flavescens]MDN6551972.1 DUF3027 domain-containing protein [Corynebacterium flavescens]